MNRITLSIDYWLGLMEKMLTLSLDKPENKLLHAATLYGTPCSSKYIESAKKHFPLETT